jgi:SAM-dependent methyltransferase
MRHEELNEVRGLSTPLILRGAIESAKQLGIPDEPVCLDIGSGNGELIQLLREELRARTFACDYVDGLMRLSDQKVEVVDLDHECLPYEDSTFDLITITEVLEHVRDFRKILSEICRCLKPGGGVVITTPNVLNLSSRIRYLGFGFWTLFGPLHVKDSRKYSAGGHISPIHWFFLVHGLLECGFSYVSTKVDKLQKTSAFLYSILALPILLYSRYAIGREVQRYGTVDKKNQWMVEKINSFELLLGRTIIVAASKVTTPNEDIANR